MKTSTAENQAFAERLKQLINEKFGGNMSELAREMERLGKKISPQTVQTWVGERGSIPRQATLEILATALDTHEAYLLYGSEVKNFPNDLTPQFRPNKLLESTNLVYNLDNIVLFETEENKEEPVTIHFTVDEKDVISIPKYIFDRANVKPENAKFVRSTDDSMNEYIRLWDICGLDISDTTPKDGGIYAILFEKQIMFKQIFKETGNRLILHSTNSYYRDRTISINDTPDFIVIGRQFYRAG